MMQLSNFCKFFKMLSSVFVTFQKLSVGQHINAKDIN